MIKARFSLFSTQTIYDLYRSMHDILSYMFGYIFPSNSFRRMSRVRILLKKSYQKCLSIFHF
nr:MAG TPA: hypothetical protein [Caudoviricetes sp.]